MSSDVPEQYSGSQAAWQAALGEATDPTSPSLSHPVGTPRRRRQLPRKVRNLLLTLIVLAGIGGGTYALVGRSSPAPPNAGAPVGGTTVPSAPATSGPVPVANTAVDHAVQLEQALTSATSWAQLAPFLKNVSDQGVSLACLNVTTSNERSCRFGAKPAQHHAVLVGDVAALNWLPAIVTELAPNGWDVQVLTMANCPLSRVQLTINKVVDTACAAHHAFISAQLASIRPALIFSSDSEVDLSYATLPAKPKSKAQQREKPADAFTSGMSGVVAGYAKVGKVVVIGSPPGTKRLSDCLTGVPAPKGCVDGLRSSWKNYQALEHKAVTGDADYIDPTAYFCHLDRCPAIVGVTPVYIDGTRLTDAFAKSLSFVFAPYATAK